jgi:hypothetical protein
MVWIRQRLAAGIASQIRNRRLELSNPQVHFGLPEVPRRCARQLSTAICSGLPVLRGPAHPLAIVLSKAL